MQMVAGETGKNGAPVQCHVAVEATTGDVPVIIQKKKMVGSHVQTLIQNHKHATMILVLLVTFINTK